MKEKILSLTEKRIVKWGEDWVVFITPEAKKLGWNRKTRIQVSALIDKDGIKNRDKGNGKDLRKLCLISSPL